MDCFKNLALACILTLVTVSAVGSDYPRNRTIAELGSRDNRRAGGNLRQIRAPHLDLPKYTASHGFGIFTGFNSVNMQEVYVVQKQAAIRSQISPPGGQKPCLARLPNGDLLATQQIQGTIALCRSKDNGLSWGPPRQVVLPEGKKLWGRATMFSALADGTLLLAAHSEMYRSTDEGQSWQECQVNRSVTVAGKTYNVSWGENSGPHQLSDGTVICGSYITIRPGHGQGYLLRSRDGGKTWGDPSFISDHTSEVCLAVLPGDKLFACLRVGTDGAGEGGVALEVNESTDGGRTWSQPRRVLGKAQSPGFPIYLKDGRLIIVYTHRQSPHGAQAIASLDGGKTWDTDHPVILAWFSWDAFCGHPRSLVLPDGSIVTGYYARIFRGGTNPNPGIEGHCLRWRVPDDWPEKWPPTPTPLKPPADKEPLLELPKYTASGGSGAYTGFNSLNLQEIYFAEKKPAVRSQISPRGGHRPCLAQLASGELLATQQVNGNIALCRSKDEGFSWGPPREVVVTGIGNLSGRAAQFAALADGTLLLGHEKMYRSTDQGQSWQECQLDRSVTVAGQTYDIGLSESDGPHQLADGTVICSGYIELAPGKAKAYLLRSKDGGRTWGEASSISEASEVNIAVLPSGKLFACLRVAPEGVGEGGAVVAMTESSDGGHTWSQARRIEGLGQAQIPGFPLYLKDGRLLIIYGNRQFPFGAQAIASRDGGKTWDTEHPIILAWFSWDAHCGYPRSVVLPDGSIVTGYYARIFTGIHHGVVYGPTDRDPNPDVIGHCLRWEVPDDWPKVR